MDLATNIDIESEHVKADDRPLFDVTEDVETLIHITAMTWRKETIQLIINIIKYNKKLNGIMESRGDVDTLRCIVEIIQDNKDLKWFNIGRTFSQFELDTALMSSCRRGYIFIVRELVRLGANKETRDRNGNTPLLICVENGFMRTAMLLVRQNVNINTVNDFGDAALILSARSTGSVEMAKRLLAEKRINVNHQNREGNTALMKTLEARNFNVVILILDSQENPTDILEGIKNCRSETAQDIADKLGIGKTVKLLIKQNTKVFSPVLAAVLRCDVDSFEILLDCQFFEPSDKQYVIQDSFRAMFMQHKMSGEKFSENEEKILQKLLQHGASVNDCFYSFNPLMVAAGVGSCNVLRMLLNDKANLHRLCNLRQRNLLVVSAERGHSDIMELLLTHDQNMSAKSCTIPALISAMKNGHHSCVELLTKYGASLDIKFAFESFVKDNDPVCLKYLVENFKDGINHAISAEVMDNTLVAAARTGHIDIIGLILEAGANANCVNGERMTPLMEAKNVEVVNFLVQRGAVVNNKSTERNQVYSPLTYVLSKGYYECDTANKVQIIEALLKNGASVNGDIGSNSPLMTAILNKAGKNIVQLLLDNGADVTVRDDVGNTVLLIAAENSSTENIKCLLQQHKVRNIINVKNHEGSTALMISTSKCNHSAIKVLIDQGADVNMKDKVGNTSLMIALSRGIENHEILTTLIQAGSDVNSQNNNGYSPLMLATLASCEDALILLVYSGADVNAVGGNNETALSIMMQNFDPGQPCFEYLLDHGARASYVKSEFLIHLILRRDLKLIPKLIQGGLGPVEVCSHYIGPASITPVSPLCLALMTGNVKLASYFVENLFLTKYDMFTLIHHKDVRSHLHKHKLHECLGFLDKQAAQPLSLFSLAFIAVQSAVRSARGREERVSKLPLPSKFKDRLLFKTEIQPLDMLISFNQITAYDNIITEMQTNGLISQIYCNSCILFPYSIGEYFDESSSEESSEEASSDNSYGVYLNITRLQPCLIHSQPSRISYYFVISQRLPRIFS